MTQPLAVLVVDDDEVFLQQFAAVVAEEGHEVVAAPSAARALVELERRPFDVVFTDLRMPRRSGLDLLKEIARRWPNTRVVVVTGYATVETAVEAMRTGAFDYVQKPFRREEALRVLSLASEELAFGGLSLPTRDPVALATELAVHEDADVLLIGAEGTPPGPRVTFLADAGREAYQVIDAAERFVGGRPRAGIVVADVSSLLAAHPVDDAVAVVRRLKELVEGRGPLAVGMDPGRVRQDVLDALRRVLAAPAVHGLMESLASPIRRSILRRLESGPATFKDAMVAAGLDESPKLSFHVRKLVDEGLIGRAHDTYRLTEKGSEAMEALRRLEVASTRGTSGFITFGTRPR